MTTTNHDRREQYAAGLRELADFLLTHPDVPLPDGEQTRALQGSDEVMLTQLDQIAASIDVPIKTNDRQTHHEVVRTFGPVSYRVFAVVAEEMERWNALTSYNNCVQPEPTTAGVR